MSENLEIITKTYNYLDVVFIMNKFYRHLSAPGYREEEVCGKTAKKSFD